MRARSLVSQAWLSKGSWSRRLYSCVASWMPFGPKIVFINRKNTHSINVPLICGSKYKITNVVARWPGTTQNSRILLNSQVGERFEAGALSGILLGDSGYPLIPSLTNTSTYPILQPSGNGVMASTANQDF